MVARTTAVSGSFIQRNMTTAVLWILLLLVSASYVSASRRSVTVHRRPPFVVFRGGGQSKNEDGTSSKNVTLALERYVAAMEEHDSKEAQEVDDEEQSRGGGRSHDEETDDTSSSASQYSKTDGNDDHEAAVVGVKHHHKKSNAVGDPDGNSSDDDDDDTENDSSEWEEFMEEMQELQEHPLEQPQELQVKMELVNNDFNKDTTATAASPTATSSSSGVGVRLANRLAAAAATRKGHNVKKHQNRTTSKVSRHEAMARAWLPHVYLPLQPPVQTGRAMDAASKLRLDRRTLYGSLLLEWQHAGTNSRKFLEPSVSRSLLASLSLATQPKWRRSFPQANCISLVKDAATTTTLAMQETIAMAMAHSLGCGMVILDDAVLQSVRQELQQGNQESKKASNIIKSLLSLASEGKLTETHDRKSGSIASCMQRELDVGLDDPFDERATSSVEEMRKWEQEQDESTAAMPNDPLPLVVFIRTESATSLLQSKSAVEQLLQECTSSDSIHLIVLGKGIDATTTSLPVGDDSSPFGEASDLPSMENSAPHNSAGGGPWFGFSPQNVNASGHNDPEGSRRFNIFLARTTDRNGTPGVLGAIAPPQAGNLFPHMLALQARERLQDSGRLPPPEQQSENGNLPPSQLEQWAQMLQQQMQGNAPFASPQFFNATLVSPVNDNDNPFGQQQQQLPPEVVQHALQHAMSDLLDRLAQLSSQEEEGSDSNEFHPDLQRAFGHVLRNDNLRRGIAENLARAAPALTDPKCQGVMLSVYVPPPPHHANSGKLPGHEESNTSNQNQQGGWFHKILNNAEHGSNNMASNQEEAEKPDDNGNTSRKRSSGKNRIRTLAASSAALDIVDDDSDDNSSRVDNKVERNLQKLETICHRIPVKTPTDPVRAKSWEAWIARERGAVVFRQNRRALLAEMTHRRLLLQERTGMHGVGSSLRQMLSVRDVSDEMQDVIKCAVELEAAKSRRHEPLSSPSGRFANEGEFEIDVSLHQLLVNDDGQPVDTLSVEHTTKMQYLHPSSLESALALTCRLNPSPSGGLSLSSSTTPASHRSREDILALAQDKHERALVSQVVSPQDIGVTYDMIGGLTDVKELLRQSITYPLKFPHLYSEGIAREAVKGVLLFGPPGTGKTMLAKAVATEGGASFLSVDASSVENKWLGESEKNAKAVFTLARRLAPCVIFIDEVDSLLSSREGSSDDSAHGTLTSVKTTMMSEWDGLNSGTNGNGEAGSDRVVVIGSTNRPFDLDEAVLRRFPRRILVDLPDLETRTEILEVTLAENRLDPAVNLTLISERLDGYTGSDIKEVCREAVVQISHEHARLADQGSMENANFAQGYFQRLRPVTAEDFELALGKLKRSVSERGRELSRVWEWNDEYGEIKREKRDHLPQLMNMFL